MEFNINEDSKIAIQEIRQEDRKTIQLWRIKELKKLQ